MGRGGDREEGSNGEIKVEKDIERREMEREGEI